MSRRTWMAMTVPAVGLSLTLAASIQSAAAAVAQETGAGGTERIAHLLEEGLTRAELVGLYASLMGGQFTPPACVAGMEIFNDVPASSPFCRWIEELARRGITGGCGGGNYCPAAPVTRDQMAVFIVRATADEPFHVVGESGEPPFSNGGAGDCLWQNPPPESGLVFFANPTSFFKDSDGIVHLAGVPQAVDGPGGDMLCDAATDVSDLVIFQLPAGYQPEHLEIFPSGNQSIVMLNLIIPEGGVIIEGTFVPGGSVLAQGIADGNATTLDGFTFRAAPESTALTPARGPAHVSPQALRDLLGWR